MLTELLNSGVFVLFPTHEKLANSRTKQVTNIRVRRRELLCQADSESIDFPNRNEKEKEEK